MTPRRRSRSSPVAENRVVIQVSDADPGKWNLALNNARNLQTDLGAKNVDIEIVAYGPGIGMLKADSVVGNRIGEALAAPASRVRRLREHDARPEAREARHAGRHRLRRRGVVEIMRRQQEHWAYMRP